MNKITAATLLQMKQKGELIAALTAYDAPTAALLNEAGVDVLLVGDSVGNVKLGYKNTISVTLDDMLHHVKAAARGNSRALLVADMPYLSYEIDPQEAARNAGRLIKEGGAEAVKLEGGAEMLDAVKAILRANIPVMGHLGLTPQSVHRLGGYKMQGRRPQEAKKIMADAKVLQDAGVFAITLECIPAALAAEISHELSIPTIGIGAGPDCDGQILVIDDLLGLNPESPKFVKRYADLHAESLKAARQYIREVREKAFPGPEHSFTETPKALRSS
jgi:3-methyl-2-oxobutanoate hydroxymethyltransferase